MQSAYRNTLTVDLESGTETDGDEIIDATV